MEEWIGQQWDRFVTHRAERELRGRGRHAGRAVQRSVSAAAARRRRFGLRTAHRRRRTRCGWAATGASGSAWPAAALRAPLAQRDDSVLALPARLAVFGDAALNRELYLWLALQAAFLPDNEPDWLRANVAATQALLPPCRRWRHAGNACARPCWRCAAPPRTRPRPWCRRRCATGGRVRAASCRKT
jgi:nitric oxide reductase NorD protein